MSSITRSDRAWTATGSRSMRPAVGARAGEVSRAGRVRDLHRVDVPARLGAGFDTVLLLAALVGGSLSIVALADTPSRQDSGQNVVTTVPAAEPAPWGPELTQAAAATGTSTTATSAVSLTRP